MTFKDPQLVKQLKSKASQSISKFKISAFGLNHKGEIVIKTMNSPFLNKYGGGHHAERKIMLTKNIKNIKIIILCRTNKHGKILPINPCSACKKTAQKLNIKIISILDILE